MMIQERVLIQDPRAGRLAFVEQGLESTAGLGQVGSGGKEHAAHRVLNSTGRARPQLFPIRSGAPWLPHQPPNKHPESARGCPGSREAAPELQRPALPSSSEQALVSDGLPGRSRW